MKVTIVEEGTRSELDFDRAVVSIGRAIDNDVRVSSTLVSRHHCRIERGSEGAFVIDLGSSNGTLVNGERVTRRLIELGDQIQVGPIRLYVTAGLPGRVSQPPDDTQAIDPSELEESGDDIGANGSLDNSGEDVDFGGVGLRTMSGQDRRERDNLQVFARITRELSRETDLLPLLRLIVDSAVGLVGGERGFLLMGEESLAPGSDLAAGGTLRVRLARNFDRTDIPVPRSRLSMGIAMRVIETKRPVLSVDASLDDRFSGMASVEDLRLRSVLCLPIQIEQDVLGVLYVDNRLQHNAFSEEDLDLVELFAAQAAIAILNARRVAELQERNERLEASRRQIEALNEQLGRKVRDQGSELAVIRAERDRERGRYDYTAIVGASDGMRKVFQQLDRIIETDLPVMIQGESGTGKELIARAIHFNGPRRAKPFVTENCAAMPDSLLESELFGHARGAFTGAHRSKQGLLELAHGGTLFLDEIGDMSHEMQKKLLRALQEGEFRPLGSNQTIKVDVRLLAASHRDLEQMVRQAEFREDLFYRINVLAVLLPALRERRDDVPLLAEALLARAAREAGRPVPSLSHEVLALLMSHDWPGNVRELENEMRRLVVLAQGEVMPEHLSPAVREGRGMGSPGVAEALADNPGDIRAAVAELEQRSIQAALAQAGGNKSQAAKALGISRFALQRKLEKYGFETGRDDTSQDADEAVDSEAADAGDE